MDDASFLVVPLAFDEYRDARHRPIRASEEARAVAGLLAPLGGDHDEWDEGLGRDLSATDARLRHWGTGLGRRSSMLLWFGHGESNQDDAALIVPGEKGGRDDTWIEPDRLARYVIDHVRERGPGAEWTFVLVEACGARTFLDRVEARLLVARARERLVLVATGADQGRGYLSVFRRALADVLATYNDNDDVIHLRDFAGRLEERLAAGEQGVVSAPGLIGVRGLVRASRLPEPIAAPMDVHAELRALIDALPDGERAQFVRLEIGGALGELGLNFVDRRPECVRIAEWLGRTGTGMFVVTGGAGAGKSTVLGNVALHGHPKIAELLARTGFPGTGWAQEDDPPRFDLFLPLTGAAVEDVTAAIARAAGVGVPDAGMSPSERTSSLLRRLRERAAPLRLLADALDEAGEPLQLATLFRQLARVPGVRLVVGTRPSSLDGPDRPVDGSRNLLAALGAGTAEEGEGDGDGEGDGENAGQRVEELWLTGTADMVELVRRSLEPLRPAHGDGFDEAASRVADLIANGGHEYLYANLAVREIRADPGLLRPERADDLEYLLGGDHVRLFAAAVDRVDREVPGARQVLEALAFGRGRGLPLADRVWATAAGAIGPKHVDGELIRRVQEAAAPYIMLDADRGQSVFRLAHRTFQDHFRGAAEAPRHRLEMARALLALAEGHEPAEGRDGPLNPYLARYLPGHLTASLALAWEVLNVRPGLLDRLEPRAVSAEAMRGGDLSALPPEVLGTVTTAHLADGAGPDDRRGLRRLGKARAAGPDALAGEARAVPVTSWDVRWSALRRQAPHLTLAGHGGRVQAAASLRGADGTRLLATGDEAGEVRIWDPLTGHAVVPPVGDGRRGRILTVTFVEAGDGTRTLVTTEERQSRGSIRLLNLATDEVRRAGTPEWYVSSAVLTDAEGTVHLAVGTHVGRIRLLDPRTGEPSGEPLTGHIGQVTALAALRTPHGESLLVSAGYDGTMRIWDPLGGGGARWTRKRNANIGPLGALAVVDGALLVAGGPGETLMVWDLERERVRPLPTPVPGGVGALAALGRSTVAAASAAGTVHLLGVGAREGETAVLSGHHGTVNAIAGFGADGGDRLASCGDDRTVKVWNPEAARPPAREAAAGRVRAVAALPGDAGCLLAVAGGDGTVSFRTAGDGAAAEVPHPPAGPVAGLAAFSGASGGARLAVLPQRDASSSRRLYVYGLDPATGERANLFDATWKGTGDAGGAAHPERLTVLSGCAGEDGTLVTGWSTGTIRTFDAVAGTWRRIGDPGRYGAVRAVACVRLPGGGRLVAATATDGRIRVWRDEPAEGGEPAELPAGHDGWVEALAFFLTPDGAPLLVSAGDDGTVRAWDPLESAPLRTIPLGTPCRSLCVGSGLLVVGMDEGPLGLDLVEMGSGGPDPASA
ncbi:hypothetical protein ACFHW2_13815 [Actinomadura sp. LOL_016]|uniref:hypothetical protein n=1 Tax=Actinomadura sp. LOL_016 TaxID=3345411 RepID=UPI003A84164B